MSAPSARRWSAFSVRPPSDRRSSVSATVSKRNARVELLAERRGQRPDVVGGGRVAAPDGIGDLAGAVCGLAALGEPGHELAGARPEMPGRGSARTGARWARRKSTAAHGRSTAGGAPGV